jgi:hypothetical protein
MMGFATVVAGFKTGSRNALGTIKRHPWRAAIGVVMATACGTWVCPYFGGLLWLGLITLAWRFTNK